MQLLAERGVIATNWVKAVDDDDVIVEIDSTVFQQHFQLGYIAAVVDVVDTLIVDVLRRISIKNPQRNLQHVALYISRNL